jgi:hypothetical protein
VILKHRTFASKVVHEELVVVMEERERTLFVVNDGPALANGLAVVKGTLEAVVYLLLPAGHGCLSWRLAVMS